MAVTFVVYLAAFAFCGSAFPKFWAFGTDNYSVCFADWHHNHPALGPAVHL